VSAHLPRQWVPPPPSAEVKNEWSCTSTPYAVLTLTSTALYFSLPFASCKERLRSFVYGLAELAGGPTVYVGCQGWGNLVCFVHQSAATIAMAVTRSEPSAWKSHRPKTDSSSDHWRNLVVMRRVTLRIAVGKSQHACCLSLKNAPAPTPRRGCIDWCQRTNLGTEIWRRVIMCGYLVVM